MNENAKKWVELLRSGKYRQGTSLLCRHDDGVTSYCCLGVACELYQQEVGGLAVRQADNLTCTEYNGEHFHLPDIVKKWLGLYTRGGKFYDENSSSDSLVEMNDDGDSFREISDMIVREPQRLFGSPVVQVTQL